MKAKNVIRRPGNEKRRSGPLLIKSFVARCAKAAAVGFHYLFDFWKTLPDALKTAAVLSLFTVSAGILIPSLRNPQPQAELPVQKMTDRETAANKSWDLTTTSVSANSGRSLRSTRIAQSTEVSNNPAAAIEPRGNTSADLFSTRETLARGTYGEAYRQSKAKFEALPLSERTQMTEEADRAETSYQRGDFREAAYLMQQALETHRLK
jgi:hypothetical protein